MLILAWAFEITPEGVKRDEEVDRSRSISADTGRKLNRAVVFLLIVAVGYFAVDKFVLAPQSQSDQSTAIAQEAKKPPAVAQTDSAVSSVQSRSVAVLPFVAMSSGEDDGYFADGLTEEILNYLASVPELLVTARTSSFHFKGTDLPIPDIAATLGVANVVEGSVRRAGERVRITAQLIRAADGFHLWSQTYDRTLEDVFAVQEDIAEKIDQVERGEEIISSLNIRINKIKQVLISNKPKVLGIEWIKPFYTAGHWVPEMIECSGGINMITKNGEHSRKMDIIEIYTKYSL